MTESGHKEGALGEQKVHKYFDANVGSIVSFPNAKTKQNAQIADLFVWLGRRAILVEVKTRSASGGPVENWVRDRVASAVKQITKGYDKCVGDEEIFLHNENYHVKFDRENCFSYMGLIVLNYEGKGNVTPSQVAPEIYNAPIPIQAISYSDLESLCQEIDTFNDLWYYLKDRYNYAKIHDIPIGSEKNVIGLYKLNENNFPAEVIVRPDSDYWGIYLNSMRNAIERRDEHNKGSYFIDGLEMLFKDQRKQVGNIPLGLLFAWEVGALARRERSFVGEKIDSAQVRFEQGGDRRYFSFLNPSTGNWLVFLFSNDDATQISVDTERYTWLKLIKEIHFRDYEYAVYGFGFQVSLTSPFRLLGMIKAAVMGSSKGIQYTADDIKAASDLWGVDWHGAPVKIVEFPRKI